MNMSLLVMLILVCLTSSVCKHEMAKAESNVSDGLTLELVRDSLIRQEDTIVFSLIERARFPLNSPTYDPSDASIPGSWGSLVEFIVKQTETIQATVNSFHLSIISIMFGLHFPFLIFMSK